MKWINVAVKLCGLLFGSIVLGTLLLYIVFLLPYKPIEQHVRDSIQVFGIEGTYPTMNEDNSKTLDNWTDALILTNAFYENTDVGILERAVGVYRPEFPDGVPTQSLISYFNGGKDYVSHGYARYWHGYLLLIKPLLSITDYLGIRDINQIFQLLLMFITAVLLWRKLAFKYASAFGAAMLFLRPDAVSFSMQYSPVFYISILGILAVVLFHDKLEVENRYLYFFTLLGIITNYFDFLTYPIAALGLPLTVWICKSGKKTSAEYLFKIILYSICWGFGYCGMWIGKWVIAGGILHVNVIQDALNQIVFRTSSEAGQISFTRGQVILRNLTTGFGLHFAFGAMVPIAACIINTVRYKGRISEVICNIVPYFIIGIMPFVWYAVMGNHSYTHHWFTYRTLVVTVFGWCCMLAGSINPLERMTD